MQFPPFMTTAFPLIRLGSRSVRKSNFSTFGSNSVFTTTYSQRGAYSNHLYSCKRLKSSHSTENERDVASRSIGLDSKELNDVGSRPKIQQGDQKHNALNDNTPAHKTSTSDKSHISTTSHASDNFHKSLPSQASSRESDLRHRVSHYMDNFQSTVFTASQRLNDLTGYSGIEALKKDVEAQELELQESRRAVKNNRAKYFEAIATRSTTQREVNDLLQRKNSWSPTDLERFTSIYRNDHANEQAEAAAQKEVGDAELRYEEASTRLSRTILARYHEEQIWSDKIRQMSTWGTWGLMGLNILLFIVFQIAIEPWRRRRLVKGFEEKVELALKEKDQHDLSGLLQPNAAAAILPPHQKVEEVADSIAEQIVDAVTGSTSTPTSFASTTDAEAAADFVTTREIQDEIESNHATTSSYAQYEEMIRERFSERQVIVTQRELTTVALEGIAGGAALMGLLFALLRPR